jgi:uncharacterized protein (TIGR03084 family)
MFQQVVDLRAEGEELASLLGELAEDDWARPTPFKGWTINDVIEHLHVSDRLAVMSLTKPKDFADLKRARQAANPSGEDARDLSSYIPEIGKGKVLFEQWKDYFAQMCDALGAAEPDSRVPWFGPDMGVRMFTTARQMETWAHGQDIYDLLRKPRHNTDRLKNIAVIGVKTYGWTFANRGLDTPGPMPYVSLSAPSGELWQWGEPDAGNRVEGSAGEFCHVVTQGRNIADTALTVVGEPAEKWMAIAQCFAGAPKDPPRPGERTG